MNHKDEKGLGNNVLSPKSDEEKYGKDAEKLVNSAFGTDVFKRAENPVKKDNPGSGREENEPAKVIRKWKDQPAQVKKNIAGGLEDKAKKEKAKREKRKKAKKAEEKKKNKTTRKKNGKIGGENKKIKDLSSEALAKADLSSFAETATEDKEKNMEKPKVKKGGKNRIAEAAEERQKAIDAEWEKEEKAEDIGEEEKGDKIPSQAEAAKRREEKLLGGGEKEGKEAEKTEGAGESEEKEAEEKEKTEALEEAREGFIRAEKNYEKYRILTGNISKIFKKGERVAVKEEYEKAKMEYESVRAEYVGEKLDKFIDERIKIADERAEKFEKSKWKKSWDWAGKQNLEKLGWKPEGRIGKFLAKGINLRTAVSLGLLGTGIGFGMGSAVGLSALIAKRVYGAAATATGSYELLRMGTERYPRLTEKKLESLDLNNAEELMAKYEMRAKLKGEKVSENENYQKLKERYLEIAGGLDKKVEELMKSADEKLEKMSKKLKRSDLYRKIIAVGAGTIIGAIGLNKLMEQMYGGPVEEMKKLVDKAVETPARAEIWKGTPEIPETDALVTEAVTETKELPDTFIGVVQANEGYIHEARKALAMYIHEFGDEKLQNLTPAQKIWAEDRLFDLYRETHPGAEKAILKVGDKVVFNTENIKQVLGEVQEKFGAPEKSIQLSENLKDYIDNVKWDRYDMVKVPQGEVYGWEMDEGIKAANWKEEISGATAVAEKSEMGKELLSERLEGAKQLFENATYREVYDRFNISPDDYNAIKNVPTGKFIGEFSYWNAPKEMISGETDHLELWRKLKIKDLIVESGASAEELKMPLHEYLKQHWFGKALEDISKTKTAM